MNCRVDGSVFGGGKGVQFGNDGTENLNKEKVANVCGSISLSVDPGKGIGGTVYGAGEYGHVGGEGKNIHVSIKSGKIGGDVFCGGLGESGRNATTTAVSKLSIDGADIAGSVYGGSKFGNDNIPSSVTDPETNSDSKGSINIYVISGDIRGNTSGNVYGGGYKGHTNSDVHIEIGSPGATSSQKQLKINSIFGGSSVGEYTGTQEVLLYGDTDIIIHPNVDSKNQVIAGDVFGSGDYCDIGGRSSVRFDRFVQDEPLLSIQKVDDLLISDSRMTLAGTVDGSIQEMTSRLSLNLIDTLTLKAGASGGSKLILMAESSQISNLVSKDGENGRYNTLSIRNGMMFSILGKKNAGGEDVKRIQGDIAIDNGGSDESDYYGAVILGKTEAADKFEQHFWVEKAGKYIEASYFDKSIMLEETNSDIKLRVWYLQGAFKIEKVVILDATDYTNISQSILTENVSVTLPRVTENSESNKLFLASFFIREDASGTLILGPKTGLNENNSGDVLNVKANKIDLLELGSGKDCSVDVLVVSVSTHSGFKSNGYRGTIVMHFVEYRGEIPISVFDFELSIYLKMVTYDGASGITEIQEIKETLVIRGSEGSWYAQRDIYLPIHGSSISRYVIERVNINEGNVTGWKSHLSINAYAVSTNVGRTGWMDTMYYSTDPLALTESTADEWIGTGGITPPVVRLAFEFKCDNHPDSGSEVQLNVKATDEITGESWKYRIIIMFTEAPRVEIKLFDRYLIKDGNKLEWEKYSKNNLPTPVLEATMEYGSRLSDAYVAVSKGNDGYEFKLPISNVEFIRSCHLYQKGDKVLLSSKDELSKVLGPNESDYDLKLLTEVIKEVIVKKEFIISEDQTYDYGYYRFSDSEDHPTEINLGNAVTSDRNIYFHYGVNVSILPQLENGTKVNGDATPSSFISDIPGQSISLKNLAVPPKGYELEGWRDGNGVKIEGESYFTPYSSDATLIMIVKPRDYEVLFKFSYSEIKNGNTIEHSVNLDSLCCNDEDLKDHLIKMMHYNDKVEVSFTTSEEYIVDTITSEPSINPVIDCEESYKMSKKGAFDFFMPDCNVTINVNLSDMFTLDVVLASGNDHDGAGQGLNYDGNGTVEISPGKNHLKDIRVKNGECLKFSFKDGYVCTTDGRNGGADKGFGYNGTYEYQPDLSRVTITVYVAEKRSLKFTDEEDKVLNLGYSYTVKQYDPRDGGYHKCDSPADSVRVMDRIYVTAGENKTIEKIKSFGAIEKEDGGFEVDGTSSEVTLRLTILSTVFRIIYHDVQGNVLSGEGKDTVSGWAGKEGVYPHYCPSNYHMDSGCIWDGTYQENGVQLWVVSGGSLPPMFSSDNTLSLQYSKYMDENYEVHLYAVLIPKGWIQEPHASVSVIVTVSEAKKGISVDDSFELTSDKYSSHDGIVKAHYSDGILSVVNVVGTGAVRLFPENLDGSSILLIIVADSIGVEA